MTMHVNGRMISLLGAAALLAAALMTAAGTTWYEGLSASASAGTASLDATIACGPLTETDPANAVAPASAANTSHGWILGASGVYPGYSVTCAYTITNPAPVPWHLETISLSVTSGAGTSTGTCTLGGSCEWTGPYFSVTFADSRGCQVDQSGSLTGAFTITGTDAPAAGLGPFHVQAALGIHQWNESIYAGCGAVKP